MYHFVLFVSIIIDQVTQHRWASLAVSQHLRATQALISTQLASSKVLFVLLFQKFGSLQQLHARDHKSSQGCNAR
jgi:hypothetical protein